MQRLASVTAVGRAVPPAHPLGGSGCDPAHAISIPYHRALSSGHAKNSVALSCQLASAPEDTDKQVCPWHPLLVWGNRGCHAQTRLGVLEGPLPATWAKKTPGVFSTQALRQEVPSVPRRATQGRTSSPRRSPQAPYGERPVVCSTSLAWAIPSLSKEASGPFAVGLSPTASAPTCPYGIGHHLHSHPEDPGHRLAGHPLCPAPLAARQAPRRSGPPSGHVAGSAADGKSRWRSAPPTSPLGSWDFG